MTSYPTGHRRIKLSRRNARPSGRCKGNLHPLQSANLPWLPKKITCSGRPSSSPCIKQCPHRLAFLEAAAPLLVVVAVAGECGLSSLLGGGRINGRQRVPSRHRCPPWACPRRQMPSHMGPRNRGDSPGCPWG